MDAHEIEQLVDELPDELVDYIADLQAENDELKKRLEVGSNLDGEEDPIAKALDLLPEELAAVIKADRERLEKAEAELAKQREAALRSAYVAKAQNYADVVDDVEKFADTLRTVAEKAGPEIADTVEEVLKAAQARVESANIFGELGSTIAKVGAAEEQAEAIAKSLRESDPNLTEEEARALVWERNPELYERYVAERRNLPVMD